ncbi:hypothetical protein CEXT_246281 [Caerostris extrusa]|uniref:Uncharacterized protein n=1 Tax=Caerostris extrusa TaxID=172846 RepID=A0AAV4R782_CAEEX|nr:hypothetical protein CEXT_246281 [Caerostris extrusa]
MGYFKRKFVQMPVATSILHFHLSPPPSLSPSALDPRRELDSALHQSRRQFIRDAGGGRVVEGGSNPRSWIMYDGVSVETRASPSDEASILFMVM